MPTASNAALATRTRRRLPTATTRSSPSLCGAALPTAKSRPWQPRLANLVRNAANKIFIAAAGSVAPIIELMRSGTADCKANAALVMTNLGRNDANRVAIAVAGAAASLVELLQSGTDCGKEHAAAASAILAWAIPTTIVAPLVKLLENGTADCKANAAMALANMAAGVIAW